MYTQASSYRKMQRQTEYVRVYVYIHTIVISVYMRYIYRHFLYVTFVDCNWQIEDLIKGGGGYRDDKAHLGFGFVKVFVGNTHGCERCAQNEKLHRQENKWFLIIQSDNSKKENINRASNTTCQLSS